MKNPFLSLWLSAANQWLGAGRGLWMAELHRQQAAMYEQTMRQAMAFWTGGLVVPAKRRRQR